MIAIVDYGSGNVAAIANIYKRLKLPHVVTRDHRDLSTADRFILPGVGAFDATMACLERTGLSAFLSEQILGQGKPVLGVCVGMQILAESSDEGELAGLGWIPGHVRRIDASAIADRPKLPHMGWNSVSRKDGAKLFESVDCARGFYFLHSYYLEANDPSDVSATVRYGNEIPCAVARGHIFGMQFHPEKSHDNGISVFRNFAELI